MMFKFDWDKAIRGLAKWLIIMHAAMLGVYILIGAVIVGLIYLVAHFIFHIL